MSLTSCITKAGSALSAEDRRAIQQAALAHRAAGMSSAEAAQKAKADQLAAVRSEIAQAAKQAMMLSAPPAPSVPTVLNQSVRVFDQTQTEAFKRWSNDAPLITSAEAPDHKFVNGEKIVVEAYHGTKRPDRIGTKFLKKRATSGPMAYHTSDPALASSYAAGKADTSLSMEDQDYSNWFKVKMPGDRSATDLVRSWYRLDAETKNKIAALAPRVTYAEEQEADGGNKIVLGDESVISGTGSYDYNLAQTRTSWDRRGNPLKALVEDWLSSGNLFNDEERFMQVLKLAGFPMNLVEYDSPNSEYPFVYKNYIAMQKPLVTSDFPQEVVDALSAAAKKDRTRAAKGGADAWDKNTRTLKDWVAVFNSEDNKYVWTSIPDKVTAVFKSLGYDGIVDYSGKGGGPAAIYAPVYIPFAESQVKSAIGNKGTFKDTNNILNQGDIPRAQISFPADITTGASVISLLAGADLSSFIHESSHFFLEVQNDLAQRIQAKISAGESVTDGERGIVEDMNRLLKWFGVEGSPEQTALDAWGLMSLDERRTMHEKFARGFELYAFEGKAPSLELQEVFSSFRAWLAQVYRVLTNTMASDALDVKLNDDVRAVMDRMLATDQAIEEAEAARGFSPMLKTAEEAATLGWSLERWQAYQDQAKSATQQAVASLDTRVLKDMQWMSRAQDKALKARQAEVEEQRREIRAKVRLEVYSEPVYQAWQFLTGRGNSDETVIGAKKAGASRGVDPEQDSVLVAIAKFGGVSRESAQADLDISGDDLGMSAGVLGKPPWRKEGGLNADRMREQLTELGYLHDRDEFGRTDLAGLRAAVSAEMGGEPQYSFAKRYDAASLDSIGDEAYGKLSTQDMRDRYGEAETAIWRKLSALRMTSDKGIESEAVADRFGFDSGDALVKALAEALPPKEAIEARTDARMLQEYGDITSPEAMAKAANEAVSTEARARFIASEMKALQEATTVRGKSAGGASINLIAQAAKQYAAQIVGRMRIRDIRPGQFTAAEGRNAKLADKAFKAAKLEEAGLHKRNQLVNNYAAKAALDAQAEVAAAVKYARKFDKPSKSLDTDYHEQIDVLLERFDFKPASLKAIDKRKSLAAWAEEQRAQGIEPNIPDELLQEAARKSYKDMTLEELRGLIDTVKQIEHLGRLKNRLLTAKGKREFDTVKAEIIDAIVKSKDGVRRPYRLESNDKTLVDTLSGFLTEHRKLSSLIREIDSNSDDGPLYTAIGRSMNSQDAWEGARNEAMTVKLMALFDPLQKLRGGLSGQKSMVFIPEIGVSMTRQGRMSVVLNYGNEDGRQRLMSGKLSEGNGNWTDGQIKAVMATLSPQELQAVNNIWVLVNEFWPEIAAKEKRVNGVAPDKVEAAPFTVTASDGTVVEMAGGYYPLKYDSRESAGIADKDAKSIAEESLRGAITSSTTKRGHTKARVEGVKHKLRLDLGVVTEHVQQVVHDLAWHEWLIDANKIFRDGEVSQALSDYYGADVVSNIKAALQAIAGGDQAARDNTSKFAFMARSNISRAVMGWSITTAFLQPFGSWQSMARIGVGPVMNGFGTFLGTPKHMGETMDMIREKSPMMRLRAKTMTRELYEISSLIKGKSQAARVFDTSLFYLTTKLQAVADVPTWLGAYNKALQEHPADEQRAIDLADRAVIESQGSGSNKDLAKVQRDHPFLTQFMSYFSAGYQIAVENTKATDFKNPRAVAGWAGDMALLAILPAIIPSLIMHLLKGGDADDPEKLAKKMLEWQAQFLLAPIVYARDFTGVVAGFDYTGPPATRIFADTAKLGKQVVQGEVDDKLMLAMFAVVGDLTGIPTAQIMRSYRGWVAWDEGKDGAGPQSVLFGPPPKE